MQLAQLVVRKQVIVRSIRVRPSRPGEAKGKPISWREGKRLDCLRVGSIAGATLLGQDSVDFILRDRTRIRARLNSACPALDYYHGFYLTPGPDGMICADRDSVRSRIGRQCGIERFRKLHPVRGR